MMPFSEAAGERLRKWRWLVLPPVSSAALVIGFSIVLGLFFDVELREPGLLADMMAETLLAYWLFALLRPWWLFLLMQTLAVGTLYVANGLKIAFFGLPVKPSDFDALPVLLDQVEGWRFLFMLLPLLLLVLLFLAGLRWRWWTLPVLAGGALLVAAAIGLAPGPIARGLDGVLGYSAFGDIRDFEHRGPLVYLLNEQTRNLASAGPPPSQEQVSAALDHAGLPRPLPTIAGMPKRDVYVFMMETLWDASLLKAAHFDRDPLAPAFRWLWEQAGESKAMVPVFGSGTPNSEFEALCGVPAFDEGMVFMRVLKRPMMCLPRLLARLGYRTAAFTPDSYGVWNRGEAFGLMGFERFYDKRNLRPSDRNGQFISDVQLFQQVDSLMAHDGLPGPRLTYISTDSGHYPFELDETVRPSLIHTDSDNPLVQGYANSVYYDSQELAGYIARIRARDPDAIIVAFGDHLPALRDPQLFERSHLLVGPEGRYTPQMFVTHQSTPLLVIDGTRGPLKLGHVSLFELPRLLMSLLDVKRPTGFDAFALPAHLHVRSYGGRVIALSDDGRAELCRSPAATALCAAADAWDADMRILRADILGGHDHTDDALYGPDPHRFDLPAGIPYLAQVPLNVP
jgi:phosphoglycerol transferase MdoB-like AlkP superfamily enzyme